MLAVEARGYKIGYEAYKESALAFKLAERELLRQIEKWIWRIANENGISYAEAKKLLTVGELEEFRWDVSEYIEKGKENAADAAWLHELENASARAHISRLEAMKLQLREYFEEAFNVENTATETALAKIYESEYYHTAYEVQKGINVGYEIGGINEKAISRAVKKPWAADGKDFSSRIWDNKAKMVGELEQELTRQIITGDSPDAAIEALSEYVKGDVGNAKQKAGTLIMTESAAIGNQAQHDSYAALGVKEYEVIETLDTHTCAQCGEMDSKHFPMDQFMIGVTAPPFHPNCRGCTAPYFDDEFQPQQRAARDPETGKTVMVDNMTYKEWSKEFVVDDTKTVQEYRSVERGETGDFEARHGGKNIKISAEKAITYSTPVYAMEQRDFMGAPKDFADKNGTISIKAYQVKGHDKIFTQTNTNEAQDTISLISSKSDEIRQLQTVSEIVVAKDVPGIASYDHVDNRLYINERISSADYIEKQLASGYFVAENAEDILRHEMHHKDHWDNIKSRTLTSGKSSDIVKQEIEADLREYVKRQLSSDPAYIRKVVSKNAETGFKYRNSLNELIADSLLQDDKEKVIDPMLAELVQRCIK